MPVCPCCHGTQFEVNPLDEALCCVECGTVNQEAELRTESGHHFAPARIQTTQESETAKTWLQRFAIYFDGSEETYNEALHWYKAHHHKCPRKFPKELALYIIYLIKKPLYAGLSLDDMRLKCPNDIDEHRLRLVHSRLSSFVPQIPMDWKAHLVSHFQSLFELVSKNIMHYHKKNKKRSSKAAADRLANEKDVQSMTTQLLTLFNDCDGGAGRHLKPLFSAAIAISYLYYYQKHYATKAARSFYPTLQQMLDPKKLASQLGCGYRTILNYLNELQNFILVCIRNTPGIAQHKKDIKLKNAYIFLDQVVKWIKPKDNNDRTAFPLQQETVPSYLRAQEESHRHEAAFERAKAGHIDDFERDSLEFNMRLLLDNGVEQNIVAGRSEVQIKQMCSVYYYRSMVNSTTIDDIPDLDQRELTQHDMSEAELAGYLR